VDGCVVRLAALIGCLGLASCDQFARVGVREAEVTPPAPERDAAPIESDAAGVAGAGAGGSDAGAQCPPVEVAVCNPVANEGCPAPLGMQCAIDHLASLTGYCIFSAPTSMFGAECLNTGVTESCPATSTCHAGRCQQICLCDADCDAAQCCTDPIESTGFKVCGDC
jgi:hypothetical protein